MYKKFIFIIFIIASLTFIYFGRYVDEYVCENNFYDFSKKTGLLGFDFYLPNRHLIEIEFKDSNLEATFNIFWSVVLPQFTGETDLKIGNMKGWILFENRLVNYRITKDKLKELGIGNGEVESKQIEKSKETILNRHKFYEFGQGDKKVVLKRNIKFDEESGILSVHSYAVDTIRNDDEWETNYLQITKETREPGSTNDSFRERRRYIEESMEFEKTAKVFIDGISSTTNCKLKSSKLKLDF